MGQRLAAQQNPYLPARKEMAGKYHRILGVPAGASREEIKRAYRRKAMRYHPDLNDSKGAQEKFLELKDAYEGLLEGRSGPDTILKPKGAKEATRKAHPNDPYKPAEDVAARHRRKAERELQDGIRYYKNYRHGVKYKVTTVITGLSILLGVLLVLDFGLPFDQEKDVVDRMYYKHVEGTTTNDESSQVYFLEFAPDRVLEVELKVWAEMNPGDAVIFKRTPLFGLFLEMDKISRGYRTSYSMDHLLDRVFWFMLLLLFMPIARYFLDRPHVSFYFFEFTIRTAVIAVMIFVGYQIYTTGIWVT